VQVVGHDDEVVHFEFSRSHIRAKDVNEKRCVAFRLQKSAAGGGFRGGEKCARGADCVF
jgi:hypothetical protein